MYRSLYMRLADARLDAMVYNPMEEGGLEHRVLPLTGADAPARLKALESAVYDDASLLAEYARTRLIIEAPRTIVVPSVKVASEGYAEEMRRAFPDLDASAEVLATELEGFGAVALSAVDGATLGFVRRTFPSVKVSSHLAPLLKYFRSLLPEGHNTKIFANLRADSVDVAMLSRERLMLLNRFAIHDPADAVYYVMAVGEDSPEAEIVVSGRREMRDRLMPQLRRFRPSVMPMIFPSAMFRAGASAMDMPFDLTVMPLCE